MVSCKWKYIESGTKGFDAIKLHFTFDQPFRKMFNSSMLLKYQVIKETSKGNETVINS